jgi:hypothetical protein
MPNINLRDKRNRDALVRADGIAQSSVVRYVDKDGTQPKLRHVLRATAEHTYEKLRHDAGGDDAVLAANLVAGDADTDLERVGMFLTDTSRVYVNSNGEIVYQIQQTEIVRDAFGVEKERRPRRRLDPNVESDVPIAWTGRLIKKSDAIRRFVFSGKLQIVHVNGLTYDFLYGMAKELSEADSMMLVGAGQSGKDPLIFRRGSTPYRGFLEGRINGDKYILLLHLSKLELKRPQDAPAVAAAVVATVATAPTPSVQPVAPQPAPAPTPLVTEPTPEPMPLAAEVVPTPAKKVPSVADVLAATAETATPSAPVKADIAETVASAKKTKSRATGAKTAEAATTDASASDANAAVKPAAKPRARKPKSQPDAKA